MDPTLSLIAGILLGLVLVFFVRFSLRDGNPRHKIILSMLVILIGVGAGLFFLLDFGAPDPDLNSEPTQSEDKFTRALLQLEEYLEQNPDNVEAWVTLGGGYTTMGRYSDATLAYVQAARLEPENPDHHAAIGEVVTLANNGVVTEDAKAAFEAALSLNPLNEISHFYLGDYEYAQGQVREAYDRWLALYQGLDPSTEWINLIEQRLTKAAGDLGIPAPAFKERNTLPIPGEDISSMTEAEQDQMIDEMVGRLEARLKENPDDLEGWFRLGQSYMVLGREEEAAVALSHLVEARPDDPAVLSFYLQARLLDMEKKGGSVTEELAGDLNRLLQMNPNDTTALYYLGVAAVQEGDRETAKTLWGRLLLQFTPGSSEAAFVQEKLEQLDENTP